MKEAVVFVFIHIEMTVRPLVLLEVFGPLVERPRDVFFRHPNKADSIEGRYVLVGQLLHLALAGILTGMPRYGAELNETSLRSFGNVPMCISTGCSADG